MGKQPNLRDGCGGGIVKGDLHTQEDRGGCGIWGNGRGDAIM